MTSAKTLFYPLPKANLIQRYKPAFDSLLGGNSATLLGFPGSCGYAFLKFIFSQPDILSDLFPEKNQKLHLFTMLDFDSLPELSTINFHKHLLHQIVETVRVSDYAKHQEIEQLLTQAQEVIMLADAYLIFQHTTALLTKIFDHTPLQLSIIINDYTLENWDEAWGRNFYRLWTIHRKHPDNRLSFLFITTPYQSADDLPAFLKPLRTAYFESVYPLPLFNERETQYVLTRNESLYDIKIPEQVKQFIWETLGGYYQFYFAVVDNINRYGLPKTLKEAEKAWLTDTKILEHFDTLYKALPAPLKAELAHHIEKGAPVAKTSLLTSLGVAPLATIWSYCHKHQDQLKTNDISLPQSILGKDILTKEPLTNAELSMLTYLVGHVDQLVSRDALAQAVWGDSEDAYSDWAIDKLVSRLRNKVVSKTLLRPILTVKGKGYKFIG